MRCDPAGSGFHTPPRRLHGGLRLGHGKTGGAAQGVAALGQFVGRLLAAQGLLGQVQALVVSRQGQPGRGHFRHQTDLGAAPGFGQRQVVFQRFVLKVLHPPEHIQLVAAQTQLRTVLMTGTRRAAAGHRAWCATVCATDAGIDGGNAAAR